MVVFITHHHGDHINGLVNADDSLVFPNARYVMGKKEWDFWDGRPRCIRLSKRDDEYITRTRRIFQVDARASLTTVKLSGRIVPGRDRGSGAVWTYTTGHHGRPG